MKAGPEMKGPERGSGVRCKRPVYVMGYIGSGSLRRG